jgi:hypothetical protein
VVGKPVVLAAIEQLALPEELAGRPVVDMRSPGGMPWDDLIRAVRTGESLGRESLARFRVPRPLRIAGAILAGVLAWQMFLFIMFLDTLRDEVRWAEPGLAALHTAHVAVLLAWIAFTTRWSWRFLRRRATEQGFQGMLAVPYLWLPLSFPIGVRQG